MTDNWVESVFAAVPLERAAARVPARVEAAGGVVSLERAGDHGGSLRYRGVWRGRGRSVAVGVAVQPASRTVSQVDVTVAEQSGRRIARRRSAARSAVLARALAAVLAEQIEQRNVAPVPAPAARHRSLRIALPAVAVVTVSAVVAATLLAPSPVTLETATARYRQAASAATVTAPVPAPAPPQRTAAPRPRRHIAQAQPAGTTPDTNQRVPARTAAPRDGTITSRRPAARRPPKAESARSATTATSTAAGADAKHAVAPEPGVYRYATDGWEELDVPRGHRRFPEETTQTVVRTDCGYRVRWDPLEERWDENVMCLRDGTAVLAELRTYRSFFGRSVQQQFTCRAARPPQGAVWAARCESDDTTVTTVARPLGKRTMAVDGEQVAVRGLQVDSQLEGANSGERSAVLWHARHSGVLVHTEVSAELEVQGPFGMVDYREQYSLHLASQQPHR